MEKQTHIIVLFKNKRDFHLEQKVQTIQLIHTDCKLCKYIFIAVTYISNPSEYQIQHA